MTQLFAFESDFVQSLRCIPMAVRFKLDRVGIKLSLRQWSRFTHADRHALLLAPCETRAEIDHYRADLIDLVARRAGEAAKALAEKPDEAWRALQTPDAVHAQAARLDVASPTALQWRRLGRLERFALLKLTRPGHDNVNFLPALREFGLCPLPETLA